MPEDHIQVVDQTSETLLSAIQRALHQLQYGSVEITVHAGRVTLIERREKIRLSSLSSQ